MGWLVWLLTRKMPVVPSATGSEAWAIARGGVVGEALTGGGEKVAPGDGAGGLDSMLMLMGNRRINMSSIEPTPIAINAGCSLFTPLFISSHP
jgi:hypothetical protein